MDVYQNDDWSCIPNNVKNKNCIFFAINNEYTFAVANLLMGLNHFNPELMHRCDVLIFSRNISRRNKSLLSQIHPSIYYLDLTFPKSWQSLCEHPQTQKWGEYVLCKFYGFGLVKRYDKALWMDADMLIRGDISELFDMDTPLAWRNVRAWDPNKLLAGVIDKEQKITAPSGGLILFTHTLNSYSITANTIADAFELITKKTLHNIAGSDELTIALLVYQKRISHVELDIQLYNTSVKAANSRTKIIHFFYIDGVLPKPWKSLASYLYFTDWAENYQKWLEMGGDGPINWVKDDYYNLFLFDKAAKIKKQQKEYEALEAKYNAIRNSKSWKLTAPLRKMAKWFSKTRKN